MAVSLAETLTTWNDGITAFEGGDVRRALTLFKQCQDQSAVMLFNIGAAHLKLKSYHEAITSFNAAIKKDQHMAAAYFQRGIAQHLLNSDADAARDFDEAHRRMRGTRVIDYRQLGMSSKLFECDVLLNGALTCARSGRSSEAQDKLRDAQDAQIEKRHEQLCRDFSSAVRQRGSGCSIITLPETSLFKPAKNKVANIKKKNLLGDAKVLSSVIDQDQFSGFMGKKELEDGPGTPPVSRSPRHSPRFGHRGDKQKQYRAIYSFEPSTSLEVALNVGDIANVKKKDGDGWYTITNVTTGESGLVPGSYLESGSFSPATSPKRKHSDQFKFPGGKKLSTAEDSPGSPLLHDRLGPPARALPLPGRKTSTGPTPPAKLSKAIKPLPPAKFAKPDKPSPPSKPMPGNAPPPTLKKSSEKVVVKLHMDHTRVIQVSNKLSLSKLLSEVCRKFQQDDNSLSLWYKSAGELAPLESASALADCWREASANSHRLTLWVYAAA